MPCTLTLVAAIQHLCSQSKDCWAKLQSEVCTCTCMTITVTIILYEGESNNTAHSIFGCSTWFIVPYSNNHDDITSLCTDTSRISFVEQAHQTKMVFPTNTENSMQWALWTWTTWMMQQNAKVSSAADNCFYGSTPVPWPWNSNVLKSRKADNQPYLPVTIHALLCGLHCVMWTPHS